MAIDIRFDDSRIFSEFETVILERPHENRVVIGDFYGDPTCAVVATNREWCAVGGEGLIVYFLREPYIAYARERLSLQWKEFFRDPSSIRWIQEMEERSPTTLMLHIEIPDNEVHRLLINIDSGEGEHVD